MKDFTLAKYRELLTELKQAGYQIVTVEGYFNQQHKTYKPFVVLRHDVDRRAHNALRMAKLEWELRIKSTYYFRKSTFNQPIMLHLALWGHEIGYHYEVMDKGKGNIGVAHAIFNTELEILRCWVPVKTCAAHGNPLTKYDNRTFFESFDPEQFGLVGEAEKITPYYWTDTGRGKNQFNIKDKILNSDNYSLSELMQYRADFNLCLNIHPERWNDGLAWYRQWVFDWGCNLMKRLIKKR